MTYDVHPSEELRELFREKPYQGARPEDAQFIFVGLDANYAPDLARTSLFNDLREYHRDGVRFWQDRGTHHPFLLGGYRGAGLKYHRYFADRLAFDSRHAPLVSFVELLHLPTTGSRLAPRDLDSGHLGRLRNLMSDGRARHVFLCPAVIRLMKQRRDVFGRFADTPRVSDRGLIELQKVGATTVYEHVHFSAWGDCVPRKQREADAIRKLVASATSAG